MGRDSRTRAATTYSSSFVSSLIADARQSVQSHTALEGGEVAYLQLDTMVQDSENWQANQPGARHAAAARG